MNKKVLVVISLVAFILVSCTKETEPVEVTNGSAKITGVAKCQLDLSNSEAEYVPAGTKIMAIIDTDDLVLNNDGTTDYPEKVYSTTVGSDGVYTFSIEANAKNVNVTIKGSDFEYDQKFDHTTFVRKVYTMGDSYSSVVNGVTKIVDLYFN